MVIFLPISSKGQKYFNTLIEDSLNFGATSLIVESNGYKILSAGFNPIYRTFFVYNLDKAGKPIDSIPFGTPPRKYFGDVISAISDGYVVSGTVQDSANNLPRDAFTARFNNNGSTIWYTRITDYFQDDFIRDQVISQNSEYIYISGLTRSFGDSEGDFFLIAMDSSGAFKWDQQYGEIGYYEECRSIIQTQDGGFVLSGVKDTPNQEWDIWVIKTDSLGEVEWEKTYGDQYGDFGGFMAETKEGDYILIYNSDSTTNSNSTRLVWNKLSKENGEILIYKDYPTLIDGAFMTKPIVNTDGAVVCAGVVKPDGDRLGLIMKTTPDGDLIWSREYYTNANLVQYIYDLKPTLDSGYIFCGNALFPNQSGGITSAWVVKLDCFGNDSITYYQEGACEVFTHITHYQGAFNKEIQLFPNPANQQVNIQWPEIVKALQVQIFNSTGAMVYQTPVSNNSKLTVPSNEFSPGIYWVKVETQSGVFHAKKLVVE